MGVPLPWACLRPELSRFLAKDAAAALIGAKILPSTIRLDLRRILSNSTRIGPLQGVDRYADAPRRLQILIGNRPAGNAPGVVGLLLQASRQHPDFDKIIPGIGDCVLAPGISPGLIRRLPPRRADLFSRIFFRKSTPGSGGDVVTAMGRGGGRGDRGIGTKRGPAYSAMFGNVQKMFSATFRAAEVRIMVRVKHRAARPGGAIRWR